MAKKDSRMRERETDVTVETKEQRKRNNPENISVYDGFQTSRGTHRLPKYISFCEKSTADLEILLMTFFFKYVNTKTMNAVYR